MDRDAKTAKSVATGKRPVTRRARPHTAIADRTVEERLVDAVAQQAATAEILRVMSASPTDIQPTVDAVAKRAAHLCRAPFARVFIADGDVMRLLAHYAVDGEPALLAEDVPLQRTAVSGRAAFDCATVHHADVIPLLDGDYPDARPNAVAEGMRAVLAVPLIHQGEAHGAIFLWRREPGLFAPDQVALVETFAAQAAIAIAHVRLFRATREALEQQTATSEILRVISRSQTDVQPVFETIAANALRLCDARFSGLFRFDGEMIRIGAMQNIDLEGVAAFGTAYPCRPSRGGATQRAILTRRIVHIPDIGADPEYAYYDVARTADYRSVLSVPMLRDGAPIGTISVYRDVARPFPDSQIELLKTFAEQAVIAIENVRLFSELEIRNRDLTEALEQQTATSEILRVISKSPTDVQPVFDTIAKAAHELCRASSSNVFTFDGKLVHLASFVNVNPAYIERLQRFFPQPPSRATTVLRAILTRRIVEIPDVLEDEDYAAELSTASGTLGAAAGGFRSILAVPLLREGSAIGGIAVGRTESGPFPATQVDLLKTFADQAVIAIENVRLFRELEARNVDLTEALEQRTATSEILGVISQSPTDVQPVFDTIAAAALRLCRASSSNVVTFDGEQVHVAALAPARGDRNDAQQRHFDSYPRPPSRDTANTRAILTGAVVAIPDVLDDPDYKSGSTAAAAGYRSVLSVPLLRDQRPVGAITVARPKPGHFPKQQIALLQTFADQAVIAIQNVRVFSELGMRNRALTEALEQQTATSEILRAISDSPTEVQPVFEAIATSALRLCGATSALVTTFDGALLHIGAVASSTPQAAAALRAVFPRPPSRDNGATRAVLTCSLVAIPDVLEDPDFATAEGSLASGFRNVLAMPLMREGKPIGALSLGRSEPGSFADTQVALLRTFADQAVIAIENVRLFKALEARNADLTEALEQQTATSDILRVISRSQTAVQPVFDTIVAATMSLCRASSANVYTFDGELIHLAALVNAHPGYQEAIRRVFPRPPGRESAVGRAILTRDVVEIPDLLEDRDYGIGLQSIAGGFRRILAVPLLREEHPIGAIIVGGSQPGRFPVAQIELLKTFADQAVIAIENVRLFNELEARTGELTRSVDELRALGEVGQAVSSTLDLETVLSTIVARATQLTGMDGGSIYEYDEGREEFHLHTADRLSPDLVEALRAARIRKGEGALGRMAVTGEPVQIRDIMDESSYQSRVREILIQQGYRSVLAVPLLRENHLLGGLAVNRKRAGAFDADVIALLQTFASQSALAIQNARLFREIEVKSRQLEVASKHKSDFLANMSHELRTPLNAIIGFSEVLTERYFGDINDKQAEYVNDIHESGQHLLALINDILDLSKIEAGRMELDLAEFDLAAAITNTLALVRERAQRQSITLCCDVDAGVVVRADQRKVKQVLLNLLSNALKFTPEGGTVSIRAIPNGNWTEIAVIDSGVGIAPEDQEAVFEEFRQVGAKEKKIGGTGLGLAISRKFIELHGGWLRVASRPGAGSTFTFTLPRH